MDVTMQTVSRLYEDGLTLKEISRRLNVSEQKVRKILITTGQYKTPQIDQLTAAYQSGQSIADISAQTGLSAKAISAMLPYQKGPYGLQYATINALRIRKSRIKKSGKED